MKLLFCPECNDVFRLTRTERVCECGATKGMYLEDGLHAKYSGGIPLGFTNHSFIHALTHRPLEGLGKEFTAFVIPTNCPTMKEELCLQKS